MHLRPHPFFVVFLTAALVSGCAEMTPAQRQQLGGATAGAGLGALVGGLTGRDAKSALIGAAVGAAAGWTTVALAQYQAQQTRSAEEEAQILGYKRGQGTVVKMRKANVMPQRVAPGQNLTFEMEYALLSPRDQVTVEEDWEISKGGQSLTSTPPRSEVRRPGGWKTKASLSLPREAEAGTYLVKNRVRAGTVYDVRETRFTIGTTGGGGGTSDEAEPGQMVKSQSRVDPVLMQAQGRLKELGHDPGAIDGRPGKKTTTALKMFQKEYGLPITGKLDAETTAALGLAQ
jgi:hypothetical protein